MAISKKANTSSCPEKILILRSIGIIVMESKEKRMVTYTKRYSSGNLIPMIQQCQDEFGIKFPLENLQLQVTILVSLLFITISLLTEIFFHIFVYLNSIWLGSNKSKLLGKSQKCFCRFFNRPGVLLKLRQPRQLPW